MKLSEQEEKQLIDWAITFFELGFNAAVQYVTKSGPILAQIKTQAVRDFINSIDDKQ